MINYLLHSRQSRSFMIDNRLAISAILATILAAPLPFALA